MTHQDHISICLCTYKRPERLRTLLSKLQEQHTGECFTYSIVVVDNDKRESARQTVDACGRASVVPVSYHVEPEQSIAAARNRSVANATGNLVAFIDDDEVPVEDWLLKLYKCLLHYNVDGVHGPVKPFFEVAPPAWTIKARLFDRPSYETGFVIDWPLAGTGNVLLRREALEELSGPFKLEFGSGGEDTDFFRRSMSLGRVYVWCNEAEVYEFVPQERTRLSFQLRRALLRGRVSLSGPAGRPLGILKSAAASLAYSLLLPVFLIMGWHVFLTYLIRDFDHIGKLLAACGLDVIRQKYIVE